MSNQTAPPEPLRRSHENPQRGAWRRSHTIATLAALLVGVAVLGYLAHLVLVAETDPAIHTDQRVVKDWQTKLAPALGDLNELGDVPGLRTAEPARINPCSYDSGELFDLSAGRYWDATAPGRTDEHPPASVTPSTAHAFVNIVTRLQEAGWHVTKKGNYLGMDLPPGLTYDGVDLTKQNLGVTDTLSIQLYDDGVDAYLTFTGAQKACGGNWG